MTHFKNIRVLTTVSALLLTALIATASPLPAVAQEVHSFNVAAPDAATAIRDFGMQSGVQILAAGEELRGKQLKPVSGKITTEQGLLKLLEGTGLTHRYIGERAIALVSKDAKAASAGETAGDILLARSDVPHSADAEEAKQGPATDEPVTSSHDIRADIPEILVTGSRSLNADIRRTEDGVRPYVVFGAEEIARSQAASVEEFLKNRLPMNSAVINTGQFTQAADGNFGTINLRGLGINQTLILVDGRRIPNIQNGSGSGAANQPNVSGIPLSAIERIEVLPSSAGGIYGGGATGGVVNIILRHDYSGVDAELVYGNTFKGDVGSIRASINGGFALEGGRTQVTVTASYQDAGDLMAAERDFSRRSRALLLSNNPAALGSGTPPMGAAPNICAATEFFGFSFCDGTPLVLDSGTALGASLTSAPVGYSGPAGDAGQALAANAGRYNLDVVDDGQSLMRNPEIGSASVNVRREFTDRIVAFVDGYADRNETSLTISDGKQSRSLFLPAADNPFQQGVLVTFQAPGIPFPARSRLENLRAAAGVIARLPHDWSLSVEHGWARGRVISDSTFTSLSPAGEAVLGQVALQDLRAAPVDLSSYFLPPFDNRFGADTITSNTSLRASGPLFRVPAGPMVWSALLERRDERNPESVFAQDLNNPMPFTGPYYFFARRSLQVESGYLETRLPLLSMLEAQASVRRDRYRTVSTTVELNPGPTPDGPFAPTPYGTNSVSSNDYMLGLKYSPVESLILRASYATGFLPPALYQIVPGAPTPQSVFLFNLFNNTPLDPLRGNTPFTGDADGNITVQGGGNPGLQSEESKSWSAGVIVSPAFADGLRLSIDYTRIRKSGEINDAPTVLLLLANEAQVPGRVLRGPNLSTDEAGWAGPVIGFNQTALNIAHTLVETWDAQLDYQILSRRYGIFRPYAIATFAGAFERQLSSATSSYDSIGFVDGPLKWRGNFGLGWERAEWRAEWNAQYFDSYSVFYAEPGQAASNSTRLLNQGREKIASQLYHDLSVRHRFGAVDVAVGVQNVFNKSPPILAAPGFFSGTYSTYGDPRLRRFTLTFKTSFTGKR